MKNTTVSKIKSASLVFAALALFAGCTTNHHRLSNPVISDGNYNQYELDRRTHVNDQVHYWGKYRSYDFITDTGGILVFEPKLQLDGNHYVDVLVDVSGNTHITTYPTKHDDNLGVSGIVFGRDKKEPSRIFLYVRTGPLDDSYGRVSASKMHGISLGELEPGDYTIEYLNQFGKDPVLLRSFSVK